MNGIEAMRSMDERPRELLVRTRSIEDQVQVTVEDSGPGLDPKGMEKIFDPFYTTKASGMGMGLKDGEGTIFHFALPKYRGEERRAGLEKV